MNRCIKMAGSTPTGRGRPYSYYVAQEPEKTRQIHISTETVDSQLRDILAAIQVDPERLSALNRIARDDAATWREPSFAEKLNVLTKRLERLNKELLSYARLHAKEGLSENEYLILRHECQASIAETEKDLLNLSQRGDDIGKGMEDVPALLAMLHFLFFRLDGANQKKVVQLIFRKIIIDDKGRIIRTELNPPFKLATNGSCRCPS